MRQILSNGIVALTALLAIAPASAARGQESGRTSVDKLVEESRSQQDKVKELGEKLRKAGESLRDADKPNTPETEVAAKEKAFNDLQAEYDKEIAKLRDIVKKLDDASKQGGQSGKSAESERDEAIQNLAKMLGDLLAQILGAFFGGSTVERDKYLGAASKAVLGVPLSSAEIAALANVPKDRLGRVAREMTGVYKSFQGAANWPVIRDSLVSAAVMQLGGTTPAAQALKAVGQKLKDGKPDDILAAAKATLTEGKFNTQVTKSRLKQPRPMVYSK